jgi:hypothetical protein
MANQLPTEISMVSQLSEISTGIGRLRSDPELRSRIDGREAVFQISMWEALTNAVSHGNRHDPSKRYASNTPANQMAHYRSLFVMKATGSIPMTSRYQRTWEKTGDEGYIS